MMVAGELERKNKDELQEEEKAVPALLTLPVT